MADIAHSERAHALLGASKASQWINCPPSARLQEKVPEKRSAYADEGTAAHEYSEMKLRRRLTVLASKERAALDKAMDAFRSTNQYYNAEMETATDYYVEAVEERYHEAKARSADAVIMFEERLDFSEWVPQGYGTGDVSIVSDGVLEVIDLKYGKGVPVSAVGNPQLRLYGLGAWSSLNWMYDIREVRVTIVQPRLDSVSSETIAVDDLLTWAEETVKPAASLAWEGGGEFKAGDHCKFCKVKATCRARADQNMQAVEYEFKDPALLTLEEIGQILHIVGQLKAWAGDVETFAQEQAVRGVRFPHWKLVEGRSNRTITDKDAARDVLLAVDGITEEKIFKPRELVGIGDLEKAVGKKELVKLIGGLIVKPPGKPVLVPETDPRPELNSVENDFAGEDFDGVEAG